MAPKNKNKAAIDDDLRNNGIFPLSSMELLPSLVKFTGETSATEAKEWTRSVKGQATVALWSSTQTLETAKRLLTKAAKSWFLYKQDDIKPWEDYEKEFYTVFIGSKKRNVGTR